jgi:hypothetical protein
MGFRNRFRGGFGAALLLGCGLAWGAAAPLAQAQTVASKATTKLTSSEEFSTTGAAAQHCPGDKVTWSTLSKSKVFHLPGSKYYGKTKHGAYVCEKDALAAGYHPSKR